MKFFLTKCRGTYLFTPYYIPTNYWKPKYLTFSDDRTFPNINCGESREHRDIPEDDNTNFQHVRGGENTLISKVGVQFAISGIW